MKRKTLKGYNLALVESEQDITDIAAKIKSFESPPRIGIDTETSGLDYKKDTIAGICISIHTPTFKEGYYIPLSHINAKFNADKDRAIRFTRWLIARFQTYFFNRDFDLFFLEQAGLVMPDTARTHDTQIMIWEAVTEYLPSLKDSAKKYLNVYTPSFAETMSSAGLSNQYNFRYTDPEEAYTYAALDPLLTVDLAEYAWKKFPYIRKIYPLDNRSSEIVRNFTKEHLAIDYKENLLQRGKAEAQLREVQQAIFNLVGYQFSLNSNKEKAQALSNFVTLTKKTKTGQFTVKAEVLQAIDHPLARLLVRYAEVSKFVSSYINAVDATQNKSRRVRFSCTSAPTGRLASGGAENNSYYAHLNIQAIPKTEEPLFIHKDPILGYRLTVESEGALGTSETKSGFRRVFNAPPGYLFMSFDYGQMELKLACSLSREKNWAVAFNAGADIHMQTAKICFNKETKEARSAAKSANFGIIYGMSAYSLANRIGVSPERGKEIYDNYFRGLPALSKWMYHQKVEARKKGMTFTYYGRPRNLMVYYNTSDPKKVAFADRSAVNTVVQGAGADVLRKKYIEVQNLFNTNSKFKENSIFAFSCYDEMNFYVKPSYIETAYKIVEELMREEQPNWLVPLTVDGSVGYSWGDQISKPTFKNNKVINSPDFKFYDTDSK